MATAADASDNAIDNEFLRRYMGGAAYSKDGVRRASNESELRGGPSLYNAFEDLLTSHFQGVTEAEFTDFITRFTYVKIEAGAVYAAKRPQKHDSYFSRGEKGERLGALAGDGIRGDNETVARRVGEFHSFHLYNTDVMFAGIASEVICQLPEAFKKSDKSFYYTISGREKPWFRYNAHWALIDVYEVVVD